MKNFLLRYFFWFLALQGGLCLYFAPIRSSRLIVTLGLVSLLLAGLAIGLQRSQAARGRLATVLDNITTRPLVFRTMTVLCCLIFAAGWLYLFLPVNSTDEQQLNFYFIYHPLVAWLTLFAFELGLAFLLWRGLRWELLADWKVAFKVGGVALGILLLLWGLIVITRLGLERVGVFWYAPGTPLLLTQVLLAGVLGLCFYLVERRWNRPGPKLDVLAACLIWALACFLWISTPVTRATNFLPAPVAPNYAPYPFSDTANYDVNAQGLLIGQGFSLDPSLKPIYSLFLAFLHLWGGQNYNNIASLQILFLALIPVGLYGLGSLLSNRPVGLIAALLFILREQNSLALSNIIQVSHVKLLLSDLPATGLMVALMSFTVGWLVKPETRRLWPLAAGGVLGMSLVLRAQIVVIIPFLLLGVALVLYKNRRVLLRQGLLLMLLGTLASTLPWVGYSVFANARLQSPDYLHLLALQFRNSPADDLKQLPGETTQQFDARIQNQMMEYVRQNPTVIVHDMTAYFFRNLVQSVTYLPLSAHIDPYVSVYARRMSFWDEWNGDLPVESRILLALHFAALAFGFAALWRRFRWLALFLPLIFVGYVISLALPMLSGWRFLLPVDWMVNFLIVFGWVELFLLGRSLISPGSTSVVTTISPTESLSPFSRRRLGMLTAFFLLMNASLPVAQAVIPVRYPLQTKEQLLAVYPNTPKLPTALEMDKFLSQKNAVAVYGRALYPRFYDAGGGLRSTGWASFIARDYNRVGFYVVGATSGDVVLPLAQPPASFPHASDVRIFGCLREPNANNRRYIQAWVVIINETIYLRATGPAPDCAAAP